MIGLEHAIISSDGLTLISILLGAFGGFITEFKLEITILITLLRLVLWFRGKKPRAKLLPWFKRFKRFKKELILQYHES